MKIDGANVFIEGPNGSGKSALADYVKNLLRYDQVNLGHRDGDQFRRYIAEYGRTSTVFCRAHWSEAVYSELFGRPAPFTEREYNTLTSAATLRGVTVLCLPPLDLLKQRYLSRIEAGLGASMVEKFEQLGRERDLWATSKKHAVGNIVYQSRSWEEMRETAQRIVNLVRGFEVVP